MDYDFLFKILLVGQSGVGKTSLLHRFVDDIFREQSFSTIGVDYKLKTLEVKVKEVLKTVKLQLWDTAGQERFHSITAGYFRGAHGVMLVFALDDLQTFKRVQYWLDQVETQHVEYKILIGNKSDVKPRQVTEEMIDGFCKAHPRLKYMETSAKTGKSVEYTFIEMSTALAEFMTNSRQLNMDKKSTTPRIVVAEPDSTNAGGSKCCGGTG